MGEVAIRQLVQHGAEIAKRALHGTEQLVDALAEFAHHALDTAGVDALGQIARLGGANHAAARVLAQRFLLPPFGRAGLALPLLPRPQLFGSLALFPAALHAAR